ncbi:hypothetical protein BCR43DRAFT_321731 [Syncephalastrum racemosum]|uniref:UspA domain-containing protein n=1 Tax=Syncephalastrum racemosum TaxID=13706 RepID=A0A1X2H7C5_SYNRA|nr:hypothetical protein BCR43DRAFT_321731 [Syncephalastrum racemosum]
MMTASEKDSSEILLTSDEDEEDCDELSCMVALDTILPMDSRFSRLSFQSANSRRLYRRRVSFEHTKSYTLRTTSQGYCHNSQSRLFMIIADDDEVVSHPGDSVGSTGAAPSNHSGCVNNNNTAAAAAACGLIRYTMEELVNDGDEIVVLGFVHEPHRPKDVAAYLLRKVLECQCDEDKALKSMIQMYEPTMLIVGCRKKKKSLFFAATGANTTNHIIHNSLKLSSAPVIFVQPPPDHHVHTTRHKHRRTRTASSFPLPKKRHSGLFLPIHLVHSATSAEDLLAERQQQQQETSGAEPHSHQPHHHSFAKQANGLAVQLRKKFTTLKGHI